MTSDTLHSITKRQISSLTRHTTQRTSTYCINALSKSRSQTQLPSVSYHDRMAVKPPSLMTLPLPKNFFKKPYISASQIEEYEAVVDALLQDTVERQAREKKRGDLDSSWCQTGSAFKMRQYLKAEEQNQYYRLEGEIRAQLSLLLRTVRASNDDQLLARRHAFHGDALDGQNLCYLRDQTLVNGNASLAIQWEAFAFSASEKRYRYDHCTLDYAGSDQDIAGNPMVFKVCHSIHLPQCTSLYDTHGLRRMEGTEVLILRPCPTNSSMTQIIVEGSFAIHDVIQPHVLISYLENRCQQLQRLSEYALVRRLASIPVLDRKLWASTHEHKCCGICMYRFHLLSRKIHCHACGAVVCKSCVIARKAMFDGGKKEKNLAKDTKFCKKCVIMATDDEERSAIDVFKMKEIDDQAFCSQEFFSTSAVTSTVSNYANSAQDYIAKSLASYRWMSTITSNGTCGNERVS